MSKPKLSVPTLLTKCEFAGAIGVCERTISRKIGETACIRIYRS